MSGKTKAEDEEGASGTKKGERQWWVEEPALQKDGLILCFDPFPWCKHSWYDGLRACKTPQWAAIGVPEPALEMDSAGQPRVGARVKPIWG